MNRLKLCILSAAAIFAGMTTAPAQQSVQMTLDQAIEVALSESNTIKIADMTIEKSGYAQKGSYASLYPNISASGSYQRTLKKQVMVMDMGGEPMEIKVGRDNNINAGVNASLPLINAQLWQSLKLSALNVELAVEQARSSKVSLISQVKQAFYGVLLAQESLELMQQIYDNADKNYERTLQRYNVGKASEQEMLRAKVNMMNAEPSVSSAENIVSLSKWQLKALMGINLDTEIEVIGKLDEYVPELLLIDTPTDLNQNSTLQQFGIQLKQLDATLKMQKFQYIPTLAASIGYNYMAMGDSELTWHPTSTASLSLNIPIFDGFSKRFNIKQTRKTIDMLNLQKEDTERNLRIAMKTYTDQMELCLKNFDAAKNTVDLASKSYQITEKMYEVGKVTLVELNDAQLALTQSQLTIYQAIHDYMVAKASLDELLGNEE